MPFFGFVVAEAYEATCAGAAKMILEGKESEETAALLPGADWFVATLVAEALLSQDGW